MNENLLQYLWETLSFDFQNLKSIKGESVQIINQGEPNPGDGPDFINASIFINGLKFYGDVECHLKAKLWYNHNHHKDSRYNRVILHVVLHYDDLCDITRSDGTKPVTIVLKHYLSNQVWGLLQKMGQNHLLPCSGLIEAIPLPLIRNQWEKAHNEYFEYKTTELQSLYPLEEPPSKAWKYMLTAGLFDTLGISSNRQSMIRLHRLLDEETQPDSLEKLIDRALSLSGLIDRHQEAPMKRKDWDFSSSRPSNQPNIRIPQACMLMHNINRIPHKTFLKDSISEQWKRIIHFETEKVLPIGKQRLSVLYTTVFVPSIFIYGNLFFIDRLKSAAYAAWNRNKLSPPPKIQKIFKQSGFPKMIVHRMTGSIFQYKHYCKPGNCYDCNLMKNILKS